MPIVKVQLPLDEGLEASREAFIYAEGRRNKTLQDLPDAAYVAMNGAKKAYFNAEWKDGVGWVLGDRADEQPW
jgi:hypothetical protein